jgi:hypothetical protein
MRPSRLNVRRTNAYPKDIRSLRYTFDVSQNSLISIRKSMATRLQEECWFEAPWCASGNAEVKSGSVGLAEVFDTTAECY